jgi:hypothetical protein
MAGFTQKPRGEKRGLVATPLLHRFAPHVSELPVARHVLRDWLDGVALDDQAVQELLVVATELCTDAVSSTAAGLVTLRAWEDDGGVVVEVEGSIGGVDTTVRSRRGLRIVEGLCDEVLTMVRGRSRFVRCRKRAGASL